MNADTVAVIAGAAGLDGQAAAGSALDRQLRGGRVPGAIKMHTETVERYRIPGDGRQAAVAHQRDGQVVHAVVIQRGASVEIAGVALAGIVVAVQGEDGGGGLRGGGEGPGALFPLHVAGAGEVGAGDLLAADPEVVGGRADPDVFFASVAFNSSRAVGVVAGVDGHAGGDGEGCGIDGRRIIGLGLAAFGGQRRTVGDLDPAVDHIEAVAFAICRIWRLSAEGFQCGAIQQKVETLPKNTVALRYALVWSSTGPGGQAAAGAAVDRQKREVGQGFAGLSEVHTGAVSRFFLRVDGQAAFAEKLNDQVVRSHIGESGENIV